MSVMKSALRGAWLLLLTACGPSEPNAGKVLTASAAEQPSSNVEYVEFSAVSSVPASEVSASEAASAGEESVPPAVEGLNRRAQSVWQDYSCDDGQTLAVRYYQANGQPMAQIKFGRVNVSVPYSKTLSNEDLNTFSDGRYSWTVSNWAQTDFYQEVDGFLVRHDKVEGMGDEGVVDNLLLQNCQPPHTAAGKD